MHNLSLYVLDERLLSSLSGPLAALGQEGIRPGSHLVAACHLAALRATKYVENAFSAC